MDHQQRLNFNSDVRELKLGSTFTAGNQSLTSFHTLKYDFKPASVDLSKVAKLDVSSNNQVTVTVPNIDSSSSGQPAKTVFKGNQRNYAKECVLIIDKITGEITLEKLHHNIQVKKTRTENTGKPPSVAPPPNGIAGPPPPSIGPPSGPAARIPLENSTQRTISKTRVSTGSRKNAIGSIVQRHSPIHGSPSYPHHKSPQQAPAWNANNTQSTLPSIPMIDDDIIMPATNATEPNAAFYQPPHFSQPPAKHGVHPYQRTTSPLAVHSSPPGHQASVSLPVGQQSMHNHLPGAQPSDVGVLSTSDSSSDSDSSGSGSDSDDDDDASAAVEASMMLSYQQQQHSAKAPGSLPRLLDEDLRLSESNSSDSD